MAWSVPRTANVGDLFTAAWYNAEVRDNLRALNKVGRLEWLQLMPTTVETVIDSRALELNGVDVSRSTYASLWTLYGTTLAAAYTGSTTLSGGINNSVTSLTLAAWPSGWPSDGRKFLIQIDSEKMLVTAGAGTTSLTVTRGVEGTTAASHSNGAAITTPSQSPFGHGNGSTTFTLPDPQGRSLVVAARSGGHALTTKLNINDGVALANRAGTRHRHTPHRHTWGDGISGATLGDSNGTGNATSNLMTTADGGSGVATDPLDGGASITLGILAVVF